MKKILVALVVLALAGGGAFAQGWTFNGLVNGGLGLFFFDDADHQYVAPINSTPANGFRTQLQANFVNNDGNAGMRFRLRAQGNEPSNAANPNDFVHFAFGWMSFDMVTVYGGLVDVGYFNSLDRMFDDGNGQGLGLLAVLQPMDGLTLGFGAFSGGPAGGANGVTLIADDSNLVKATVSFVYEMPDFLRFTGSFRTGNNAWVGRGEEVSQLYVSGSFLGDADMHAAATIRLLRLEDFGDLGQMHFHATFGHTGLVDNMGIHAGVTCAISMVDDSDLGLWIWAGASYQVSERIVPRLDIHYMMGGAATNAQSLHTNMFRDGFTFNSDDSQLQIRPSVQFIAAPGAFVQIGCVISIDLGDEHAASPSWGNFGTNFGIYALMQVSF